MKLILIFNAFFFVYGVVILIAGEFSYLTLFMVIVNAIALIINAEREIK